MGLTNPAKEVGIAKPIPMKRELKPPKKLSNLAGTAANCKAYPDEKGIETAPPGERERHCEAIAKPIPMKRELKLIGDDPRAAAIALQSLSR